MRSFLPPGRPDAGMALVTVLIFSGILLILGSAMLSYTFTEKLISTYHEQEIRLYYITEAGIDAGLTALQGDFSYGHCLEHPLAGGSFSVQFDHCPSGLVLIKSTGTLENHSKEIAVEVVYNPGQGPVIDRWIKP